MTQQFPIIFLGTNELACFCLQQLLLHSDIVVQGVITPPPQVAGRGKQQRISPVAQKAQECSFPILTPDNLNSEEFLSTLYSWKAQWAIVLAYGKLLPKSFLTLFPNRVLNFHASILPRWRGAAPIQRAIMAGDQRLGMTLQVVEPQLDTGAIVAVRSFDLETQMDAGDVFTKMEYFIQELLGDLIQYMSGEKKAIPQDSRLATYAHKIEKKESVISWSNPSLQVFNQIRSLVLGPQAYTIYRGKRLKIYKSTCTSIKNSSFTAGEVVDVSRDYFTVACQDFLLKITEIQPESKKVLSVAQYLRGVQLKKGEILGG